MQVTFPVRSRDPGQVRKILHRFCSMAGSAGNKKRTLPGREGSFILVLSGSSVIS